MEKYLPKFILALLFALGLHPGVAQVTAPAAAPETDADAPFTAPTLEDTSLLWRISSDDTDRPSYLFGTIHIIPAEDYFLDGEVVRALNDVERVYFEIDPADMQDPSVMMSMMGRIRMRGDTSLQDLLTPVRYDSVAAYFNGMGIPFAFLQNMKPMFLSAMVGQDFSAGNPFGGGGAMGSIKSYEIELAELADAADKERGALETMDFQLSLFDSIPYTVQANMLYETIAKEETMPDGSSQMDEMVSLYKRRAVAEMSQMITSESAGHGNFEELLLVRRNENWVPQIREALAENPTLYAVGAGHLGGERGVIALLRAEGLRVEPVF